MFKFILIILSLVISQQYHSQTIDASGKKQGYWKKKNDKTNKLVYEGLFKDDKPQGLFKYYNINDSIKAKMNFVEDGKFAYATLYHLNGKKMAAGKYIGEDKDSVWNYFDDKGILISQESFLKGKKNGKSYVYFPDGIVSEEYNFKNGQLDGAFKQYFDKKSLKGQGNYVNGKMEGKNTYYYPNGIEAAVGYYKNGSKNGPWIYKETSGKIKEKELYKLGGDLASKKETEDFFNKNKIQTEKQTEVKKDTKPTGTKPKAKGTK